ncbi:MAG: hypothetical protein IJ659_03560, partial [Alloprevotella sp.]|nr:hypothetical protein [Alloprevotella sp.]
SRLPNFIVEFDPQKKHFLHHINNKCSKGKYLSAFPKISPLKMTNKPIFVVFILINKSIVVIIRR